MNKPKSIIVRTGTTDEFLAKTKKLFKNIDEGKLIKEEPHSFIFEDPNEFYLFQEILRKP